ncbi:MAG: hypothetical protein HFE63_09870 [Clostridiales bacterium]|nr:hypothetical protein [Clostridiales bacterium]
METAKATFRNAMGGYNKQDVNKYIAELSAGFDEDKKELEERIAELTTEIEKLTANDKSTEYNNIAAELERANALVTAQNEQLESQKAEIAELQEKQASLTDELKLANDKLEMLGDTEEKLKKYDQMSAKLADLMVEASLSADKIRAEAQSAADEAMREHEEREQQFRKNEAELAEKLEERYRSAVAAVNAKLSELAADGMNSLEASLKNAQTEIETILDRQRATARATILQTAERLTELEELTKPVD